MNWEGSYHGVDHCFDLVHLARKTFPNRAFSVVNLLDLRSIHWRYDWGVLVSMRPMVVRNQGQEVWDKMEAELRRVCRKLLYLEYREDDEGKVE